MKYDAQRDADWSLTSGNALKYVDIRTRDLRVGLSKLPLPQARQPTALTVDQFRERLRANIGDRPYQGALMAEQLEALGYDVSAYTRNGAA